MQQWGNNMVYNSQKGTYCEYQQVNAISPSTNNGSETIHNAGLNFHSIHSITPNNMTQSQKGHYTRTSQGQQTTFPKWINSHSQ